MPMANPARKRLLWAVLLGAVTTGAVALQMQLAVPEEEAPRNYPVLVAAGAVEAGTPLEAKMLRVEQWPDTVKLPGALSSPAEVAETITTVPLVEGQPILIHATVSLESLGHGGRIPIGMRLITIPVNEVTTFGYRLRPGDRVDILRVYTDDTSTTYAKVFLQVIDVYAVGEEAGMGSGKQALPRTVTLVVTPEEALQISLITEDGSLRLVLRPRGETEKRNVPSAHIHHGLW